MAAVGLLPSEINSVQSLEIDLEFQVDVQRAATSDEITATVDYAHVRQHIVYFLAAHRFALLETLAQRLADTVASCFALPWVRLSVMKPAIFKDANGVGVVIERHYNL